MATIKMISGEFDKANSSPDVKWFVKADSTALFEIADWIPQTKANSSGGYIPVSSKDLDNPQKIKWTLKDKTQKNILKEHISNTLEKFQFSIEKKYCGSYLYYLEAALNGTKEKAITNVAGFCDQAVTSAKWSKDESTTDQSEVQIGDDIFAEIETEGLNGDTLTFELYRKDKADASIISMSGECINGVSAIVLETEKLRSHFPEVLEKDDEKKTKSFEMVFKVKNPNGVYIPISGNEEIITFEITAKLLVKAAKVPKNKSNLKVGQAMVASTIASTGIIELTKVAFSTTFNVCNDELRDKHDLWILDGGYHWLKTRITSDDLQKPDPLPITLSSKNPITFTAVFNTILEIDGVTIRAKDKDGKYIFTDQAHTKKKKNEEFSVIFNSSSAAYGSVQYLNNFQLIFEYSLDNKTWTPLGTTKYCLYLTLSNPNYKFYPLPYFNFIHETLLWLSCDAAKGLSDTDSIVDAIFSKLKGLKVIRRREGDNTYLTTNLKSKGLGYWRGNSSANIKFGLSKGRQPPLILLLGEFGEAKCGEWSCFFIYFCNTHGIVDIGDLPFRAAGDYLQYDPITDLHAKGVNTSKSPLDNSGTQALTMWKPKPSDIYNVSFDHIIKYDDEIPSVFMVNSPSNSWKLVDGALPKQLKAQAQGNKNPLHFFWDHVFAVRKGKYYDPSYGVSGATNHTTNTQIMTEYAQNCLAAVPMVTWPDPSKKVKVYKYKDKHTGKFVDFTRPYTFEDENKVPGLLFKYIITNVVDKLYFVV